MPEFQECLGVFVWPAAMPCVDSKGLKELRGLGRDFGKSVSVFRVENQNVALLAEKRKAAAGVPSRVEVNFGHMGDESFLRLSFLPGCVEIESDWAGTVRSFWSTTPAGLIFSTFEPCVLAELTPDVSKINPSGFYELVALGHNLWANSSWRNLNATPPDSVLSFDREGRLRGVVSKKSVRASSERHGRSMTSCVRELDELNTYLIGESLGDSDEIALPLSSGYDSRLILSGILRNQKIASRTKLFTYGPRGSIEAEAGRLLGKRAGIPWELVSLTSDFLSRSTLGLSFSVFGSSLHMHSMYQSEFVELLEESGAISANTTFTSGFMTGVPAGQHTDIGLLEFSQSNNWQRSELESMEGFRGIDLEGEISQTFRDITDNFEGEDYQKQIMLDIWTRQRNFVSYHPRFLSMYRPVASPHMRLEYINFFMSLPFDFVRNRALIERYFLTQFPALARVPSNSARGNSLVTYQRAAFLAGRFLQKLGMKPVVPLLFRDVPLTFDQSAIAKSGLDGFFPLFNDNLSLEQFRQKWGGTARLTDIAKRAISGDQTSYEKLLAHQSVAFSLFRLGAT